jgi:hypothetical protein
VGIFSETALYGGLQADKFSHMDGDKVVPFAPQRLCSRIIYQNVVYVRIFLRMWRHELRIDLCKFFCSVKPWHWVNILGVPLIGRAPKQICSHCLIDQVSSKLTTSMAHGRLTTLCFSVHTHHLEVP